MYSYNAQSGPMFAPKMDLQGNYVPCHCHRRHRHYCRPNGMFSRYKTEGRMPSEVLVQKMNWGRGDSETLPLLEAIRLRQSSGIDVQTTATDVTDLATCTCSGALGLSGNSKHPLKRALNGHLKCRHSLNSDKISHTCIDYIVTDLRRYTLHGEVVWGDLLFVLCMDPDTRRREFVSVTGPDCWCIDCGFQEVGRM
uniref:Uncharacterized protein n=1 Tax=Magallana gigas TaxID=29159 RepID=A0A8W8NQR8_MAGGI